MRSTRATPRIDHDLRISHVAIDRQHTTAEDPATYFPLAELRRTAASGRIGSLAPRFHGAPTNRSHRTTLEVDGPEIVARCLADAVDAAILVRQLPGVPPDRQPGRAPAGAERHRQRGDGLRQGHRRAGRRAAPAVLRLPARQRCRAAEGWRVAGLHARAGAAHARDGPGPAHDGAVAAALERRSRLEARLLQHRAPRAEEIRRRRAEFDLAKSEAKQLRHALAIAPSDDAPPG